MPNGSKQTICPCQGSLIIRNGPMKRNNYRIGPLKNYPRKIFSIVFPLANSSINLSKYRISCIKGSLISSTRTPQITPLIIFFSDSSQAPLRRNVPLKLLLLIVGTDLLSNNQLTKNNLIHFILGTIFALRLLYIEGIDTCKRHGVYARIFHFYLR